MGCAETGRDLPLELVGIDRDDVLRTRDFRALNGIHADPADADHDDGVTDPVPAATEPEPNPVVTPQDTSDAASSGIQSLILTNERSEATTYSEKVPTCIMAIRSSSPRWRRRVPSVVMSLL